MVGANDADGCRSLASGRPGKTELDQVGIDHPRSEAGGVLTAEQAADPEVVNDADVVAGCALVLDESRTLAQAGSRIRNVVPQFALDKQRHVPITGPNNGNCPAMGDLAGELSARVMFAVDECPAGEHHSMPSQ
jgi:hypothetical protein